jgi:hypothetical protein
MHKLGLTTATAPDGASFCRNGDKTMGIARQTIFRPVQSEVRSHDVAILFGYAAFAMVVLIAVYFDSLSSGTSPSDLASMTGFP